LLATSMMQAVISLRTGMPGKLQPPAPGYYENLFPPQRAMVDHFLSCAAIGAPETVRTAMERFIAETGADELMVTSQMYDHRARLRSYEILAGLTAG
jgi:alkanesulfonate monooxygenase SsuD/methylene tetrahydromethanopterin reductase-like flavin-dependent oxidoreductase (luciferase family)